MRNANREVIKCLGGAVINYNDQTKQLPSNSKANYLLCTHTDDDA